jgi:hypothetical protein
MTQFEWENDASTSREQNKQVWVAISGISPEEVLKLVLAGVIIIRSRVISRLAFSG